MALKHFGLAAIGNHNPDSFGLQVVTPSVNSPVEKRAQDLATTTGEDHPAFYPTAVKPRDADSPAFLELGHARIERSTMPPASCPRDKGRRRLHRPVAIDSMEVGAGWKFARQSSRGVRRSRCNCHVLTSS
jgi:hypothetical protein